MGLPLLLLTAIVGPLLEVDHLFPLIALPAIPRPVLLSLFYPHPPAILKFRLFLSLDCYPTTSIVFLYRVFAVEIHPVQQSRQLHSRPHLTIRLLTISTRYIDS